MGLLTRLLGMGETIRDISDAQWGLCLVGETRRKEGDGAERRAAHNPDVTRSDPARYQAKRALGHRPRGPFWL
jgi:hypothetical protein